MRIKGAIHIHTLASHDGELSLSQITDHYRSRGFQFICITEHSQDMTESKIRMLRQESESLSGENFCVLAGIEYSCKDALHIVGVGCLQLLDTSDPVHLVQNIRSAGGFSVLAHPKRIHWRCSPELAANLNAMEVWNVRYDGKYLPSPHALEFFNQMKVLNPGLLAAVGDDLHALRGSYPLAFHMSVGSLNRESILKELKNGRYQIRSMGFHAAAKTNFSPGVLASYKALRIPLNLAKSLRDRCAR